MDFRPCIDIHNGKVKQIVGSSLRDEGDYAQENFVSARDAAFYAGLYRDAGLKGGHIILLNAAGSAYYEATKAQAMEALGVFPGGLQIGGGITAENAADFLNAGASHVIVTSYVFREGRIDYERLNHLKRAVGREHLVLDLSCRKRGDSYYIMTDRWQHFTDEIVSGELLDELSSYCSEFLVHAVDVEGRNHGIEEELAAMLGSWDGQPVTYAGGIRSLSDIDRLRSLGRNRVNVTIGSALDLFGGDLPFADVRKHISGNRNGQESCRKSLSDTGTDK